MDQPCSERVSTPCLRFACVASHASPVVSHLVPQLGLLVGHVRTKVPAMVVPKLWNRSFGALSSAHLTTREARKLASRILALLNEPAGSASCCCRAKHKVRSLLHHADAKLHGDAFWRMRATACRACSTTRLAGWLQHPPSTTSAGAAAGKGIATEKFQKQPMTPAGNLPCLHVALKSRAARGRELARLLSPPPPTARLHSSLTCPATWKLSAKEL